MLSMTKCTVSNLNNRFDSSGQVTLWRGGYELTGEYEEFLRIRNRGSLPQRGRESVVT